MDRMAEGVMKKNSAAEKQQELLFLKDALKRDRDNEYKEKVKKDAARKRDIEIKKTIDMQIEEKHEVRKRELE